MNFHNKSAYSAQRQFCKGGARQRGCRLNFSQGVEHRRRKDVDPAAAHPPYPPNCAVSFEDCASPRSPLFSKPLQAARPGPETKLIVCRYKKMDLSKRQLLQEALVKAEAHHAYIAVSTPSGTRILLRPDFTCYETYVEGTGADGQLLTLTYEQIAAVDVE